MAMSCIDAFFESDSQSSDFRQFFEELALTEFLTADFFACDDGSPAVTISTKSGNISGDNECYDTPNTPDEDAAMELFLDVFQNRFPAVICG